METIRKKICTDKLLSHRNGLVPYIKKDDEDTEIKYVSTVSSESNYGSFPCDFTIIDSHMVFDKESGISYRENIEISRNYAAAANVIIFNQITNNFTIDNIVFKNISYQSNNVLNRIVTYSNNGTITNVQFENTTCAGTKVVDSNKTLYFSEESYWGGYITVK